MMWEQVEDGARVNRPGFGFCPLTGFWIQDVKAVSVLPGGIAFSISTASNRVTQPRPQGFF